MTCTDHADCLCDVEVGVPAPILEIDWLADSYYAKRIAASLCLQAPLAPDEILRFFEAQCALKDAVAADAAPRATHFADGRVIPTVAKAKVTTEVRTFIAMNVRAGLANREIREAVQHRFGVTLTTQYMAVLRKRVVPHAD
jgi:hypothetical protein